MTRQNWMPLWVSRTTHLRANFEGSEGFRPTKWRYLRWFLSSDFSPRRGLRCHEKIASMHNDIKEKKFIECVSRIYETRGLECLVAICATSLLLTWKINPSPMILVHFFLKYCLDCSSNVFVQSPISFEHEFPLPDPQLSTSEPIENIPR
jgi:hypothetical protein